MSRDNLKQKLKQETTLILKKFLFRHLVLSFLILFTLCMKPVSVLAQPEANSSFDMSLDELLNINIFSASRSLTSIADAPSVVTVITAEEISQQGLKTLEEVLQRVPGFFTSEDGTRALLSNRGILTNKFLLLFDGHSVNSIVKNGMFQQHIFPLIDDVERIEIIRGPGSTLWGSEAALGVINIITREDWDDINSTDFPHGKGRITYDYADTIDRQIAKLSYDKGIGEQSGLMLRGNWFTSDPEWFSKFHPGNDSYRVKRGSPVVLRDFEDDSWEIYGKLKLNSLLLSGRTTRFLSMAPHLTNTGLPERRGHFDYKNNFIEAKYNFEIDADSNLDFSVSYDSIRDHAIGDVGGGEPTRYIRSEEDGIGGELIYTTSHFDDHEIKTGIQYRRVDVRRLDEQRFLDGELVSETDQAKTGIDNTVALFAEDTWHFADKWIAVFGGRLDYNDFREKETIFLPRVGLIWSTTDRITLKYLYNTGYIRPYVQQSHGTAGAPFFNEIGNDYWVGAKDSERIDSHDIQVLYNHKDIYLGATFYYMMYDNFIEWPGVIYQEDPTYRATFQNIGEFTSKGVELDFKIQLLDPVTVYGNYSYTHARLDSMKVTLPVGVTIDLTGKGFIEPGGAMTGVPEHTWNFGTDYNIVKNVNLNVHYRGWDGAWALETTQPTYKKFGPEHYVDVNLRWQNIFTCPVDLSFYCKNLFDNTGSNPPEVPSGPPVPVSGSISGQPTAQGVLPGFGRILGLKVGVKF